MGKTEFFNTAKNRSNSVLLVRKSAPYSEVSQWPFGAKGITPHHVITTHFTPCARWIIILTVEALLYGIASMGEVYMYLSSRLLMHMLKLYWFYWRNSNTTVFLFPDIHYCSGRALCFHVGHPCVFVYPSLRCT